MFSILGIKLSIPACVLHVFVFSWIFCPQLFTFHLARVFVWLWVFSLLFSILSCVFPDFNVTARVLCVFVFFGPISISSVFYMFLCEG